MRYKTSKDKRKTAKVRAGPPADQRGVNRYIQ